jgi:hypothetical protein
MKKLEMALSRKNSLPNHGSEDLRFDSLPNKGFAVPKKYHSRYLLSYHLWSI